MWDPAAARRRLPLFLALLLAVFLPVSNAVESSAAAAVPEGASSAARPAVPDPPAVLPRPAVPDPPAALGIRKPPPAQAPPILDTTPPALSLSAKPTNPSAWSTAQFEFSANEPAGFTCKLDAAAPEPCASPRTYAALGQGAHTFTLAATDLAANSSAPIVYGWTVDTAAPTASIACNAGSCAGVFGSAVTATLSAADSGSGVDHILYTQNGSEPSPINGTLYIGGFVLQQTTTVRFRAYDLAGNPGPVEQQTIAIDTTGPDTAIDSHPDASTRSTSAHFTFSSKPGAGFECKLDDAPYVPCSSTAPPPAAPPLAPFLSLETDGTVAAVATLGSVAYFGGSFTHVEQPGVPLTVSRFVRFDGSTGAVIDSPPIASGVNASAADGSGGWFIGGSFATVGGLPRNGLAHILADGTVDPNWAPSIGTPGIANFVSALAVSGTTVYAGGSFTTVNGATPRNRIAAFDRATGAVTSFDPNLGSGSLSALAVSGSTLYVGGSFTTVNGGTTRNRLAAFDVATGLATSFNPNVGGTNVSVTELVLAGPTLYAGGNFTTVNGATTRNRLAAFDVATGLATSFNPNLNGAVGALALSGSTLYAGGSFTAVNGSTTRNRLAAFDGATGTATAFDPNVADNSVLALAVSGSTVFAGGTFTTVNGSASRNRVAGFDPVSGAVTTFDGAINAPGTTNGVQTLAISGASVYAGGDFRSVGGVARNNLAAVGLATGLLTAWEPNPNSLVDGIAASGSTVFVSGGFTTVNGSTPRNRLAAFDADTGVATGFNPNPNAGIDGLAIAGSTVYAGGAFTMVNSSVPRNHLASFDAGTGVATSFDPNVNSTVGSIAVSGSTVYAGGAFDTVNSSTSRSWLAAFDAGSGALIPSFDPVVNSHVIGLALSGSTVYAGGLFTKVNGSTSRNGLAAFDAATGVAKSFNPSLAGVVAASSLALSGQTVYAGRSSSGSGAALGAFDRVTGETRAWAPTAVGTIPLLHGLAFAPSFGLVAATGSTGRLEAFAPAPAGPAGNMYTSLAEGTHSFAVRATTVGNTDPTPAGFTWTIDMTAPTVTIDSRPPDQSSSISATFTFSSELGAAFECKLDSADYESCTSPKTYSNLGDGSHSFSVRATDVAGNTTGASDTWTVDATAPETTITSGPAALTKNRTANFGFSSVASTFACSLDGSPFQPCTSPQFVSGLADGSHTFRVAATDSLGNIDQTPASYTWTVDNVPPVVTLNTHPAALTKSTSPSFDFFSEPGVTFRCWLDNVFQGVCTSPVTYGPLTQGSHTVLVEAQDGALNLGSTSFTWTIDTTPPTVAIVFYPEAFSKLSSPSFTFSSSTGVVFECSLDVGAFASCTSPTAYTALADGSHTFQVRGTDGAGNTSTPVSYTWTIDTVPPDTTIDSHPAALSMSIPASFTFSSAFASGFICQVDAAAQQGCSSPKLYTGLAAGSHTLQVAAYDQANNIDPTPASFTWTVDPTIPSPAVTIEGHPYNPTNQSTASFAFTGKLGSDIKLMGGNPRGSSFGYSVAVSSDGNTALVGGPGDKPSSFGPAAGAVWFFTRANGTWVQQGPKVTVGDPNAASGPELGASVALSADGNTAVIGGPTDHPQAQPQLWEGAVWIFTRVNSIWTQQAKLTVTDNVGAARLGGSVAVAADGNTVVAGGEVDNSQVGAAWVFTRSGSSWTESVKLTASGEVGSGAFGWSVALSADGNTALVGGDEDDNARGAVWAFVRSGSSWSQQGSKLTGDGEVGRGRFGSSIGLSADGNTALISGRDDNNQTGAAWVFTRSGSTWGQQGSKLTHGTSFASSVALAGDGSVALIGSADSGAAWIFRPVGSTWTLQTPGLTGNNQVGSVPGLFGTAVALSGDGSQGLVSSSWDDQGVGAAWAFSVPSSNAAPFTFECSLDLVAFASCQSPRNYQSLGVASHTFRVRATDAGGNTGPITSFAWTVNLTAPPPLVIFPLPPAVTNATSVHLAFSGQSGAGFECKLDAGSFVGCVSPVDYSGLGDGSHTFFVHQIDVAGNISRDATFTWTVDGTEPTVSIDSAPPAATTQTSATFKFSSQPGSTFKSKLDDGTFTACGSPKTYSLLAQGAHTFAVHATDTAGNTGPETTFAWTVDTTPPAGSSIARP